MVVHIMDGLERGIQQCSVRAKDTDMIFILVACMPTFRTMNPSLKLMLNFGVGKSATVINLNLLSKAVGLHHCRGVLFFHYFTGCDYTSSFFDVGKVKWWDQYLLQKQEDGVDEVFRELSSAPSKVTSAQEEVIVKFTLKVYGCQDLTSLPNARLDTLIHHCSISFRSLPPSHGAKRAAFVACHLWGRADQSSPILPEKEGVGLGG